MEKTIYNEMFKELQRECLSKGRPLEECLYNLSCRNNKAWREGRSNCLSKVEPIHQIKNNHLSMKLHIE